MTKRQIGNVIGGLIGGMLTAGTRPEDMREALQKIAALNDEQWSFFVFSCDAAASVGESQVDEVIELGKKKPDS